MIRVFALFIVLFSGSCSNFISANEFNPKNYVYNDEGYPLFVKIYVEGPENSPSHAEKAVYAPPLKEKTISFFNLMQKDDRGSFIVIPIKNKKKKSDEEEKEEDYDHDEKYWKCPYCDTENPASRNSCQNKKCCLHRKTGRDW